MDLDDHVLHAERLPDIVAAFDSDPALEVVLLSQRDGMGTDEWMPRVVRSCCRWTGRVFEFVESESVSWSDLVAFDHWRPPRGQTRDLAIARRWLADEPDNQDAWSALVLCHMNRGDFEQMIATAERALALLPAPRDQAHFAALKAGALYELKRYQEADRAASYALKPEAGGIHVIWRPKALRIRTACAIRAHRFKNARFFAGQLLEMAEHEPVAVSDQVGAWQGLAGAEVMLGNRGVAMEALRQATRLAPHDLLLRQALAELRAAPFTEEAVKAKARAALGVRRMAAAQFGSRR